jgi:hypothetical protein
LWRRPRPKLGCGAKERRRRRRRRRRMQVVLFPEFYDIMYCKIHIGLEIPLEWMLHIITEMPKIIMDIYKPKLYSNTRKISSTN